MAAPWLSFLKHVPYAAAPETTPVSRIVATGCAGELLSTSVSLLAADASPELEITVSELQAEDGRCLPADAVELFVVKVWEQSGIGVYQGERVGVAELLVKDDRVALADGYSRHCGHWRHWHRRGRRFYQPPLVRVHGSVRTSLQQRQPKQLWLSVRLAQHTSPGLYRANVMVRAAGDALPRADLTIEVEVLPLHLETPRQDHFIFYKGTLDCDYARHFVEPSTMRAQLGDIYAHGFRTVALGEARPAALQHAIDIAHTVGFRDKVVISEPYPPQTARIDFRGMTPVYYVSDKIDARCEDVVPHHIRNLQVARDQGRLTMATLYHQSFTRRLLEDGDIGHAPDILGYYLPANLHFFALLSQLTQAQERRIYYYWQTHMEKPLVHRVLAGVYLWKSRADGVAPYCYQDLPRCPNSPFDDFDEWDLEQRYGGDTRPFKDHMTTYPARAGAIPTLQWKGLSDGIHDLRYLATLDAATQRARQRGGSVAERAAERVVEVEAFLDRISLTRIEILSETDPLPYPDLVAQDLAAFRTMLGRAALATLADL